MFPREFNKYEEKDKRIVFLIINLQVCLKRENGGGNHSMKYLELSIILRVVMKTA